MLKDLAVQCGGFGCLPGQAQQSEDIRQTLHAQADGAVTHVAALGLGGRIEVDVNHAVEIAHDRCDCGPEGIEVEGAGGLRR